MEDIDIWTISKYRRRTFYDDILMGMKQCIKDHGPIDLHTLHSARKRIWGAFKCRINNFYENTGCSKNEWIEIYRERWKRLVDKDGNVTLPWKDVNKVICRTIERGEYIEILGKNHNPELF